MQNFMDQVFSKGFGRCWGVVMALMCLNTWGMAQGTPRFHGVLKSREVNWRQGPGPDHAIVWIYRCPGWPVVVRRQWDQWCYVEDATGAKGWVHASLLSFKRHILFVQDKCPVRLSPTLQGSVTAYVRKGVIGKVLQEKEGWVLMKVLHHTCKGWVPEEALWNPSLQGMQGVPVPAGPKPTLSSGVSSGAVSHKKETLASQKKRVS